MRLLFLFVLIALCFSCKQSAVVNEGIHSFSGRTMGTTYTVKYVGTKPQVSKFSVDSLLVELNNDVSTYIPASIISILNANEATKFRVQSHSHFGENYVIAEDLYELTEGHFDPTLMPLVNFWGFGYTEKDTNKKDKRKVVELMKNVGFDKWSEENRNDTLFINKPQTAKLDFSASAKGYGVDRVGLYLESRGVKSYYVEIGGELKVAGEKTPGQKWTLGVNKPTEDSAIDDISKIVELKDEAMATSGNYRNFYKKDGVTYSHIINPFTGFPERSSLLSASILHEECAYADGFATACMVMGKEACKELLLKNPSYEGLLLFTEDGETISSWQTKGFDNKVVEME